MALGRYDVVHAVEEAAHLAAPLARLLGLPLVVDVDSSIPDQLRYSGFATARARCPGSPSASRRHALAHSAAVVTVCTQPHRRRAAQRARGPACSRSRTRPSSSAGPPSPETARSALRRRASASARGRSSSTRATSSRTRASSCWWRRRRAFPRRSSCSWGASRDEIDALTRRARPRAARAASSPASGPRPSCPAFLALADVLVSPRPEGENTPFKVYTYLASGKPLVATRIPTHTQLLDDTLAFLVEPTADRARRGHPPGARRARGGAGAGRARPRPDRTRIQPRPLCRRRWSGPTRPSRTVSARPRTYSPPGSSVARKLGSAQSEVRLGATLNASTSASARPARRRLASRRGRSGDRPHVKPHAAKRKTTGITGSLYRAKPWVATWIAL